MVVAPQPHTGSQMDRVASLLWTHAGGESRDEADPPPAAPSEPSVASILWQGEPPELQRPREVSAIDRIAEVLAGLRV